MPPFGAYKPVFHDRHKTVPEFIFIPYDVDENHTGMFTDVNLARWHLLPIKEVLTWGVGGGGDSLLISYAQPLC